MKGIDTGSRDVLDFFEARKTNFLWLRVIDDDLALVIGLGHGTSERKSRCFGAQKHRTKSQLRRILLVYRRRVGYVDRNKGRGLIDHVSVP